MSSNQEDYAKVEAALRKAYREKEKPKTSAQWELKVMQHVRDLGAYPLLEGRPGPFGELVWGLAPVVCVLILVLAIWMVKLDFIPEFELAKISLEHPIEFNYGQISG